jgi:hypothetical protein
VRMPDKRYARTLTRTSLGRLFPVLIVLRSTTQHHVQNTKKHHDPRFRAPKIRKLLKMGLIGKI